jgi:hypothetical protein
MEGLSPDDKFRIMTKDIPRGEAEADYVIGEDEIRGVLATRDVNLYWGTGEPLFFVLLTLDFRCFFFFFFFPFFSHSC